MCNGSTLSHFSTHWIFVANLINTFWLFQMVTWQVTAKIKGWGMLWHIPGFCLPHFQNTFFLCISLLLYCLVIVDLLQTWHLCFPGFGSIETQKNLVELEGKYILFFSLQFSIYHLCSPMCPLPFCIPFHLTNTTWSSFCLQASHAALANSCTTHGYSVGLEVTARAEGHAGMGRIHRAGGQPSPHPGDPAGWVFEEPKQTKRMQIWYKVQYLLVICLAIFKHSRNK